MFFLIFWGGFWTPGPCPKDGETKWNKSEKFSSKSELSQAVLGRFEICGVPPAYEKNRATTAYEKNFLVPGLAQNIVLLFWSVLLYNMSLNKTICFNTLKHFLKIDIFIFFYNGLGSGTGFGFCSVPHDFRHFC